MVRDKRAREDREANTWRSLQAFAGGLLNLSVKIWRFSFGAAYRLIGIQAMMWLFG
jgi:hypothetical protein